MGLIGAKVRSLGHKSAATDLGQGTPRPVEEAWHLKVSGREGGEAVTGGQGTGQADSAGIGHTGSEAGRVSGSDGHERHDLDHPETPMSGHAPVDVEGLHRGLQERPRGLVQPRAAESENRPVVPGIGVDIEQARTGCERYDLDGVAVAAFGDIYDTFQRSVRLGREGVLGVFETAQCDRTAISLR